jgi:hypothetical protein
MNCGMVIREVGANGNMDTPIKFHIEGHEVSCHEMGEHRLWHCDCADFERRLKQYGQGFCAHTAVAIMRALDNNEIGPLT